MKHKIAIGVHICTYLIISHIQAYPIFRWGGTCKDAPIDFLHRPSDATLPEGSCFVVNRDSYEIHMYDGQVRWLNILDNNLSLKYHGQLKCSLSLSIPFSLENPSEKIRSCSPWEMQLIVRLYSNHRHIGLCMTLIQTHHRQIRIHATKTYNANWMPRKMLQQTYSNPM